jgi:hypothetical protein
MDLLFEAVDLGLQWRRARDLAWRCSASAVSGRGVGRRGFPRRAGSREGRGCGAGGFGGALFEVIIVTTGVMTQLAVADVHHMIGELADEEDVVADEDHGAVELLQGAKQGFGAGDIEVIGGLVHEQEVGRIEQQLDEREAAFLTAAQNTDLLEDIVAAE